MQTIHFILLCFFALLLNFVVSIEPSKEAKQIGETEESKASIRIDSYAYWPGRGAIWKGNEGGKSGRCGGGKGEGGGKGYDGAWSKSNTWGTEWWKGGKGTAGQNVGKKGRDKVKPILGGGNGVGGVKKIIGVVNEGGSEKGESGGNFIELSDDENMTYSGEAGSSGKIRRASSSVIKDSTEI